MWVVDSLRIAQCFVRNPAWLASVFNGRLRVDDHHRGVVAGPPKSAVGAGLR